MTETLTYGTPPTFGVHPDAGGEHLQIAVEAHLTADWSALGTFREVGMGLRLVELRIYPREDRWYGPNGEVWGHAHNWSHETQRIEQMAPPQAIYPRLLHRVPIRAMENLAWDAVDDIRRRFESSGQPTTDDEKHVSGFLERSADRLRTAVDRLPGRLSDAQLDYLEAAAVFTRLPQPNRRGVVEVMDADPNRPKLPRKTAEDTIRDRLNAARKAGYLTRPGPGRRGGELTEFGRSLAAAYLRKDGLRRRRGVAR